MKTGVTNKKSNILIFFQNLPNKKLPEKVRIVSIFISYVVIFLILVFLPRYNPVYSKSDFSDLKVGEIAEKDLVAKRDIIYVDNKATQLKKEAIQKLMLPVFGTEEGITQKTLSHFRQFSAILRDALIDEVYPEEVYLKLQANLPGLFAREEVEKLITNENILNLLDWADQILNTIMIQGIFVIPEKIREFKTDFLEVWRWEGGERKIERVRIGDVITRENLKDKLLSFKDQYNLSDEDYPLIAFIVSRFAEENVFFDSEQTESNLYRAIEGVEPVVRKLVKGERIVRKGFIITEEDMEKIEVLKKHATSVNLYNTLGTGFFLLIIYILAFILLNPPIAKKKISRNQTYTLLAMIFAYLIIGLILVRIPLFPEWLPTGVVFPTALVAMLITVLISSELAIEISLLLGMLVLLVTRMDIFSFLFAFLSGVSGTLVVKEAQRRIDLIRANLYITAINAFLMVILSFFQHYETVWLLPATGWGALNGFVCGILNLSILPILEHTLNAATRFRLIELSDLNSPILKKMLTLAHGTYGHSLNVANLAEAASRNIGANPLLARVAAYYHDIGKMDQPEYFIENQMADNKHNYIKPSLSVAVIKSHVKIGIEKAKELGLPKEVVDIIAQHHGSGLISYFYSEALKKKGNTKVTPESYSYTESPPASPEAGIVMLADAVEAATRTLKKPTVAKLERLVWDIIIDKFKQGQMDDCELTFRELKIIKKSFVQILAGHFHSRIEYPKVGEAIK